MLKKSLCLHIKYFKRLIAKGILNILAYLIPLISVSYQLEIQDKSNINLTSLCYSPKAHQY